MDAKDYQLMLELLHDLKTDVSDVKTDVKAIREDVNEIDKNVDVNSTVLQEHIRRTDLAEKRLDLVEHSVTNFNTAAKTVMRIVAYVGSGILFLTQLIPAIRDLFPHH